MTIANLAVGHYRIPLSVILSDSTHGEMLLSSSDTVRVRDADGAEGVGYTYTVGRRRGDRGARRARSASLLIGAEADRIEQLWQRCGGRCTTAAAAGMRVLAISAVDIALWDLKARRADCPVAAARRS